MIGCRIFPTHSASSNENNTLFALREPTIENSCGTIVLFDWFSKVCINPETSNRHVASL